MKKIAAMLVLFVMLPMTVSAGEESASLRTQTGKNVGVSLSAYQYKEPGVMSLKGAKLGLDLQAVKILQNDQFIRGDLRYAFGTVDYNSNGTGNASGNPDLYIEARGLVGKDVMIHYQVFAFYTGLGYRYLFNDGRGVTSAGYGGYRRQSNYVYWPIGIIHRRALNDQAKLESTVEFDTLLFGKQISSLSDVGGGYSDVTNNQNSGYGLKLSIMYQKNNWIVGPYLDYWNIGQSDIVYGNQNGIFTGLVEPENNTIEFGFKVSQQF